MTYAVEHGPEALVGSVSAGPETGCRERSSRPTSPGRGRRAAVGSARRGVDRPRDGVGRDPRVGCRADRLRHRGGDPRSGSPCAATDPAGDLADRPIRDARGPADRGPSRARADAGVVVTINSDDPPMFGTTRNRDARSPRTCWSWTRTGCELATTAVDASSRPQTSRRLQRDRGLRPLRSRARRASSGAGAVSAKPSARRDPEPPGIGGRVAAGTAPRRRRPCRIDSDATGTVRGRRGRSLRPWIARPGPGDSPAVARAVEARVLGDGRGTRGTSRGGDPGRRVPRAGDLPARISTAWAARTVRPPTEHQCMPWVK